MKALSIFAPTLMVLFFVSGVLLPPPTFADDWYIYEHDLTTEDLNFINPHLGEFIVGDNGVVLICLYPEPEWEDISAPTSEDLFCIEHTGSYVVGTSGTIIYDWDDWHFADSPTAEELYSITIFSTLKDVEGFIVGYGGTILHTIGTTPFDWQIYEPSPTTQDLFSIHNHDYPFPVVWAVGAGGTILEYDYEQGVLSLYPSSPTTEDLYGVYVDDEDSAWACGAGGTILLWDGSSWTLVDTPTTEDLHSIWGRDGLFCVGANGTILYGQDGGTSWVEADCPVSVDLNGVGGSGGYLWVVGDGGTILCNQWLGGNIQPISVGKVKALFAPRVEAAGAKDDVKEKLIK